ncbi:MAG: hypothetical protein QNJ41_27515 [Xenococcaceae cyanobacterium MO_188.B32]|nr:hypothetical protein [Xenococcaceae cyanobacterium MO_188.B32]
MFDWDAVSVRFDRFMGGNSKPCRAQTLRPYSVNCMNLWENFWFCGCLLILTILRASDRLFLSNFFLCDLEEICFAVRAVPSLAIALIDFQKSEDYNREKSG